MSEQLYLERPLLSPYGEGVRKGTPNIICSFSPSQLTVTDGLFHKCGRVKKCVKPLKVATWNIHTVNSEHKSSLTGLELKRYPIDIAVLNETCLAKCGQLHEETLGYTFFWTGLPASDISFHGVAIMLKSSTAKRLSSLPQAINEHLITFRLSLEKNHHVTIISAIANNK